MAPKKEPKVVEPPDENAWKTVIQEAPIDDETFAVKVVVLESAGSEQERIYLNKFEIFAAEEKRFVIKNICKSETIFMINQLGAEKKVKDENLRVFEEAQSYLKDKKDIPSDILSLVIKHLIMKMKDEYLYIQRQKLDVKLGMQRESATMLEPGEVKGTATSRSRLTSPHSRSRMLKEGDGDSRPDNKKYKTQLRVRGEEWRDKVYVDDYPTDGPNIYVAITGFVDPYLPSWLVKANIPLTAIVQVRIDPLNTSIPSSLLRTTKRGQSLTEILTEKSMKFWEELQSLRIRKETVDCFKETAFIVFSPPYWNSENLSGNPDKIYDELCYLMYDIQDLSRQHIHYKENMDLISIPVDVGNARLNRQYEQQIFDLPLECVTMYTFLDILLQTACNPQDNDDETSRSSLSTAVTMNPSHHYHHKHLTEEHKVSISEHLVNNLFNKLCNTEATKKTYRLTYGEEYENQKDPIVIDYGDFVKYNTFQIGNINLDNIVYSSLLGMPTNNLWNNQSRPDGENEAKINFHVNVLLSCFDREDIETAELNRLVNILACRKLYNHRSSLKKRHLPTTTLTEFKKTYLKRSLVAEPLPACPSLAASGHNLSPSFPSMTRSENDYECAYSQEDPDPEIRRLKHLFDCPDISGLVTAAEIENKQPISKHNIIDDYDFFEDLSGTCAFQILRDAFNKFNCVDYKYCEVTDCFILMFFNSHDKEGIAREEWRCHLPTPLCLQDFFDFILDEHYDWIQAEEKIYDENLLSKARSESKDVIDPLALKSCLSTTDVEKELLMDGSIKQDTLKKRLLQEAAEDALLKKSKSQVSVNLLSKSNTKLKTTSSQRTVGHSQNENVELQGSTDTSIEEKPFLGYDLGDRRVEIFGKDAVFFSKDGTKVTCFYTLLIPYNLEYIVLNILPGNSYNEFWLHKALGEDVQPSTKDACDSFRITSKDQVMMYFKKQIYSVPIIPDNNTENTQPTEKRRSGIDKESSVTVPPLETKHYHSLYVTWPNGLITETVYLQNSPVLSHIKLYHTTRTPHLDEEMRCISLNGEVIIFKESGIIIVLKPDGTYIKLNKYYKRIVLPPDQQEIQDNISNKSKKKSRAKISKASSKSSGSRVKMSDDKPVEDKPLEYEIVVNDFEIIETTGLRQKCINNDSFDIEKMLIRTASDYCVGEVFSRRMDGTNILLNKEGIQIVTFPDKTRIISYYVIDEQEVYPEWTDVEMEYFEMFDLDTVEDVRSKVSVSQKSYTGGPYPAGSSASTFSRKLDEEESKNKERTDGYILVHIVYSVEHQNFSTITINNVTGKVSVDSPNETTVAVDKNNSYEIKLDHATSATFNADVLNISYEACSECSAYTHCNVKVMDKPEDPTNEELIKNKPVWLKMTDSFKVQIVVNDEGAISISDEATASEDERVENLPNEEEGIKAPTETEEKDPDVKSESSVVSHGKCREMYLAKKFRFFVLKRDLNCAELLHRALLDEYKRSCRWQPWCSINYYDTFGDHRNLVSILTPIHRTETEKWLMESKLANKPKFLQYKDLKKDSGKGFYHWMRPYERFVAEPTRPCNVLPDGLPRAFILRTLEQEWNETQREELGGAKELIRAVLRYRCIMEADSETILTVPIIDTRDEDERKIDDIIQALAHKIYEDLRVTMADEIQRRSRPSITTKPAPEPEELSVLEEMEEDEGRHIEEERESSLREVDEAEHMSPCLQRYWRRRNEEYKEEQFYLYLLRQDSVPPYFQNVLGGAIWWDVNNATGDAVSIAERRKMKCVCALEDEATASDTPNPFT
ncbi:uncharacterized protein LOC118267734 [Spodoptera frugiperda]|uniref:Uncharacterized protein LOC118267734 n=1 Tax=Spodoptera frugiperda TaxID=7108 RepID=A0A9R0F3G1_SPOFR|nr:uncharacterized protein LOC118267734 [Spodoptera frugiperda]